MTLTVKPLGYVRNVMLCYGATMVHYAVCMRYYGAMVLYAVLWCAACLAQVCECVAELARNLIDEEGNNSWPEVLAFLFEAAASPRGDLRESALIMFGAVPGIFGAAQAQNLDVIRQMLHRSLADESDPTVRCGLSIVAFY